MHERAFSIIRSAVEELNEELGYESLTEVGPDTPIFGDSDGIDSLSLVTLVVDLEREVARLFGRRVVLADARAMSLRNSPYRTAGSLANLIVERVGTA
jgi:acyl carrier protein